jgi:hypothetical protein
VIFDPRPQEIWLSSFLADCCFLNACVLFKGAVSCSVCGILVVWLRTPGFCSELHSPNTRSSRTNSPGQHTAILEAASEVVSGLLFDLFKASLDARVGSPAAEMQLALSRERAVRARLVDAPALSLRCGEFTVNRLIPPSLAS